MASLLETSNMTVDQIQSIIQFKKIKNISKQVTEGGIGNFVMAFREKNISKRKMNHDDECYNYQP